jgi:site-specific DNA-methyltransferase (adenine-specific)
MYKTNDVFSKKDKMFCAEQEAEYQQRKIVPFYHNLDKKIKLFQGDSLSILKKAPDSCIDMIFADPPYFGNQSGLVIKRSVYLKKALLSGLQGLAIVLALLMLYCKI